MLCAICAFHGNPWCSVYSLALRVLLGTLQNSAYSACSPILLALCGTLCHSAALRVPRGAPCTLGTLQCSTCSMALYSTPRFPTALRGTPRYSPLFRLLSGAPRIPFNLHNPCFPEYSWMLLDALATLLTLRVSLESAPLRNLPPPPGLMGGQWGKCGDATASSEAERGVNGGGLEF